MVQLGSGKKAKKFIKFFNSKPFKTTTHPPSFLNSLLRKYKVKLFLELLMKLNENAQYVRLAQRVS